VCRSAGPCERATRNARRRRPQPLASSLVVAARWPWPWPLVNKQRAVRGVAQSGHRIAWLHGTP